MVFKRATNYKITKKYSISYKQCNISTCFSFSTTSVMPTRPLLLYSVCVLSLWLWKFESLSNLNFGSWMICLRRPTVFHWLKFGNDVKHFLKVSLIQLMVFHFGMHSTVIHLCCVCTLVCYSKLPEFHIRLFSNNKKINGMSPPPPPPPPPAKVFYY